MAVSPRSPNRAHEAPTTGDAWSAWIANRLHAARVYATAEDAATDFLSLAAPDDEEQEELGLAVEGLDPLEQARLDLARGLAFASERPPFPRAARFGVNTAAALTAIVLGAPLPDWAGVPRCGRDAKELLAGWSRHPEVLPDVHRLLLDVRDGVALAAGVPSFIIRSRRVLTALRRVHPHVLDIRHDGSLRLGGELPRYDRGGGKRGPLTLWNATGRLFLLVGVGRGRGEWSDQSEASRAREAVQELTGRRDGRSGQVALVRRGERLVFEPGLELTRRARQAASLIRDLDDPTLPEWVRRPARGRLRRARTKPASVQVARKSRRRRAC